MWEDKLLLMAAKMLCPNDAVQPLSPPLIYDLKICSSRFANCSSPGMPMPMLPLK